ncbi:NTP transferase domain-containing protein [Halobacillus sp. A5]|uniref:nucleotidyltransferase family protein n=1 Tax=Halobacillus sp. A5 TaxID=2880263 RepID=UPI0020A66647|nr:nucleotidyltransferase family protein [Halobacillus sp. A5]MCP3028434.1 nucleotidyltransferase family protein [Halobacillus sp. A5]
MSNIVGVMLAAGESSRMGRNKLALPFNSTTIGCSSLRTALDSELDHVIVVTRKEDDLVWIDRSLLLLSPAWSRIKCDHAQKGQASSLKCGIKAAEDRNADAVVVLLADQPLLHSKMINKLISRFTKTPKSNYVASRYDDRMQPPILFSSAFFSTLLQTTGDQGARTILRKSSPDLGAVVDFEEGRSFQDIDTEDDYKWLKETTNR